MTFISQETANDLIALIQDAIKRGINTPDVYNRANYFGNALHQVKSVLESELIQEQNYEKTEIRRFLPREMKATAYVEINNSMRWVELKFNQLRSGYEFVEPEHHSNAGERIKLVKLSPETKMTNETPRQPVIDQSTLTSILDWINFNGEQIPATTSTHSAETRKWRQFNNELTERLKMFLVPTVNYALSINACWPLLDTTEYCRGPQNQHDINVVVDPIQEGILKDMQHIIKKHADIYAKDKLKELMRPLREQLEKIIGTIDYDIMRTRGMPYEKKSFLLDSTAHTTRFNLDLILNKEAKV